MMRLTMDEIDEKIDKAVMYFRGASVWDKEQAGIKVFTEQQNLNKALIEEIETLKAAQK